ncbi:hypothetical protein MBORA_12460 [Methanobrevibacter oralis]|uniref:Uncharacterized protein n=1 Tax=Methanobrevibacter oralis TaxID=66851 RepID=A0A166AQ58_METOA|nr:hypothetical protein MBORA_12460 [Methanobrevibacter oralis]
MFSNDSDYMLWLNLYLFLHLRFFTFFKILFNNLTNSIFVELAFLNSNRDIAISGAVEEFVIVIVELPFIARDPVAFILNL